MRVSLCSHAKSSPRESVELHNYVRTMGVNRIPLQNKRHPHMFSWPGFTAGLKSWQHHSCGQGWKEEGGQKCIFVCFRVSGSSSGAITSLHIRPKICVDISQPSCEADRRCGWPRVCKCQSRVLFGSSLWTTWQGLKLNCRSFMCVNILSPDFEKSCLSSCCAYAIPLEMPGKTPLALTQLSLNSWI